MVKRGNPGKWTDCGVIDSWRSGEVGERKRERENSYVCPGVKRKRVRGGVLFGSVH